MYPSSSDGPLSTLPHTLPHPMLCVVHSHADSTSSSSFLTCVSSKRCISFADEVDVSDVLSTCILSLSLRSQPIDVHIYHRSIKLVDIPPFLLTRFHHVDFLVVEAALLTDILNCRLRGIAERAWAPCEEGDAALQQARRSSKHCCRGPIDDAPRVYYSSPA
jgi:hypothetical protein